MQPLNYEELTLESDIFEQIRSDFNLLMQKLVKKMEVNSSDEGSIDLKINIEMTEDFVPQEDGTSKRLYKPTLKHKISTVVPVKDSTDGTRDTGMGLVYDEELKRYVLKYVSTGGQMNIWDMEQKNDVEADSTVIDAPAALEDKGGYFLPGGSEDSEFVDSEDENGACGDTEAQDDISSDDEDDGDGFPDDYGYEEPDDE